VPSERVHIDSLRPWIEWRFDRASGPGGQNVNKVATRVTLLFDFETCDLLTPRQRARIRNRLSTRLTRSGRLRVVSQKARTQIANRTLAEQRLCELLQTAFRQRRRRIPTRPTRAAQERRLRSKKQRGQIKRLRQKRFNDPD
jgi:ribosome-associated protein